MAHTAKAAPSAAQLFDQLYRNIEDNFTIDPEIKKLADKAMEKLVADLERNPCSVLRDQIIRKVKEFHYANSATPLMVLHADLQQAGLNDLANDVRVGVYDNFEFYKPPENDPKVNKVAKERMCTVCYKVEKGMKLCGRCRLVYYCSAICQKKDWRTHRLKCKQTEFSSSYA
jgi:MYND finger